MRPSFAALLVLFTSAAPVAPAPAPWTLSPSCPWCGAGDAPASVASSARIAPAGEPGIPLEVTGTVYRPDGRTPAADVLVYAWQVNAAGILPRRRGDSGEHGDLRGWARTDAQGRFRFLTIRPAPARGTGDPARIQMTVRPEGARETLVDPLEFDDDTLLTRDVRARRRGVGGSGIVRPATDARGVLHVVRDIVLERAP